MKFVSLSIIIPTLNEEENITALLNTLKKLINPMEIVIVDDKSSDGTIEFVRKYQRQNRGVRLIINENPIGLTASLQKGIEVAGGRYVLWMDADFSHPPELIKTMMGYILKCDIVVASWLARGGQDRRDEIVQKYLSLFINKACQVLFTSHIHTYTSGFILAKKSIFRKFKLNGNYGEYCIDFLVKQHYLGRKIVEVPFTCVSRVGGRTKTIPNIATLFGKGMGYIKTVIRLQYGR